MKTIPEHNQRIATMTFSSVYPHYVSNVAQKGRTQSELHQVIEWLTGFDETTLQTLIEQQVSFEKFFSKATLNPNTQLIKGVICGYRVEKLENAWTQKVRYLD